MKKSKLMIALLAVLMLFTACNKAEDEMTDYVMNISTFITIDGGGDTKQSAIEQTLKVNNKGSEDMLYLVETTATSTDMLSGKVVSEENSYIYYDNTYYYTYPGVRYKSPADYKLALDNIENLTRVITFSEKEMVNAEWTESGEEKRVDYQVEYEDASPFVKGILENAAATFDGVKFSMTELSASATFKEDEATSREMFICYDGDNGETISVEIYTSYGEAEVLEAPDESKYVNIIK
ncbi:MAG: hypothetical protein IJO83_00990 [Clostridia bacterium]|nr:hypothetical protein [Clostridia bacterium]